MGTPTILGGLMGISPGGALMLGALAAQAEEGH